MANRTTSNIDILRDNAKIYQYPDGHGRVVYCEGGFPESGKPREPRKPKSEDSEGGGGQKRAKTKLRDLCRCNAFSIFFTLTLDGEKINRYDFPIVYKKLKNWLDNRVRRKGLKYVLVAEHHKDGAIHFHGLCNDVLPRSDSGHKDKAGRTVYSLPDWPLGFSTAVQVDGDYRRVCNYVSKYITKGAVKVGGRWYYSGGELARPEESMAFLDLADVPPGAFRFVPDGACKEWAVWEF